MKKIFVLISCIVFILLITACGSGKKVDSLLLDTPEETIEGFISALEANDAEKAALYISPWVREGIASYLNQTDLQVLANDLLDPPPKRMSSSLNESDYSIFAIERTNIDGESKNTTLELMEINDQWYIVVF